MRIQHHCRASNSRKRNAPVGAGATRLDVDVFAWSQAAANEFSPPSGLPVKVVPEMRCEVIEVLAVSANGIASYDSAQDQDGRTNETGRRVLPGCSGRVAARCDSR